MPLPSSETQPWLPTVPGLAVGPILECVTRGAEPAGQPLRIRARRLYPVSRDVLFSAWTRRSAWDAWMRLRARSRVALSPRRGGAFRLELAEGATIHVISGMVHDLRPSELLSLSWIHHTKSEQASFVDVAFRSRHGANAPSELSIVHRGIASRREAAWLMQLWTAVLDRLSTYLVDESTTPGLGHRADCSRFRRDDSLSIMRA
ncbi:MAG TPA: SRPBCC domain-containing protein [Gemmatimonadaceae bacterium]|nr:SRPBCC domain-containing protein [Gemmatimonadaceae bacterium]